ncbi:MULTISPECIES: helix-turn-helix domain-containing protein [Shewanella]|uniref:Helix-turn-helix domain-containing protein n=2 Tax=Shewanella TaxID=22 RepID=A0A974XLT4_9GAMM|nr:MULTISPECIES: helix-turn-helix domain-containing protein [Shewanella]QSX30756.1 helix-turn-helix domain-containing protein [Shewanella cyperi]QSX37968.1 helix-turn-helix domain-containing protein [Shewanella sedimentimangrovi]QSX41532.1 helix-turn-helix domain-containing protein [Shewanella cyperi]
MASKLLTLDEVCQLLDKTPTTIKRYARENLLSSIRDGDNLLFHEEEVLRFLEFSKRLG